VSERTSRRTGFGALMGALLLVAGLVAGGSPASAGHRDEGTVVVANRAGGTLSLIDVATDTATELAIPAPSGGFTPEPMYVVYTAGRVFVGDRANDRVVVYEPRHWTTVGEVATGAGVFHMWADPRGRQLWVNNDIDNTMTVIDPRSLEVEATVPLPADLVADGGRPHDVILDRRSAHVTVVGLAGTDDAVVRFDLRTFEEKARAAVGKDPHVTLDPSRGDLFVASQNANEIAVLHRRTLERLDTLSVPAAHGLDIDRRARVVYTTNIAGGGSDALWAVDTRTGGILGDPVDAPFPTPHNIVLTAGNDKLYVTHSGLNAAQVSVFGIDRRTRLPELVATVTVGPNPFGLEFVPR